MTSTIAPKPNQHYRLSLAKAIRDYKDGIITATDLIYYAVGILRAPGENLRLFGSTEYEQQIPNIATACVAFDVLVSFEKLIFMELGS